MEEEHRKGNIVLQDGKLERRSYAKDFRGVAPGNLWVDTDLLLGAQSHERTGYPTQKPLALLERIIKASSSEGYVVLDPFCGCATALVAAEKLGRHWIGIDLSSLAVKLVLSRLQKAADDGALLQSGKLPAVHHRTDIRSGRTSVNCRRTRRTGTRSTASRRDIARDACTTSRSVTSPWITSSRSPRAAATTSTTFNCSAVPATRRRECDPRRSSSPNLRQKG